MTQEIVKLVDAYATAASMTLADPSTTRAEADRKARAAVVAALEKLTKDAEKLHALRHEREDVISELRQKIEALTKGAERYQFLKDAKGLTLRSDGSVWKRDNVPFVATHSMSVYGTSYGAYPSLDELIDAAIAASKEQT